MPQGDQKEHLEEISAFAAFFIPYENKTFNTIFSYELLESFDDDKLIKILKEGLRVSDTFVFMVPTIRVVSNALKGNEILRSSKTWEKLLRNNGFRIIETKQIDNGGFLIIVLS